jgi:endonuclease/exonuclease/phosphatase family metal-dependent hydrolase
MTEKKAGSSRAVVGAVANASGARWMSRVGKVLARRAYPVLLFVASVLLWCCGCTMPAPVRIMSFNVRYGTAPDGANAWPARRQLVFQTIRANDPDVLGLQEVLEFQARELREALPDYDFVGVGRDDGAGQGEFVPIMYRRKLFELVDCGYLWLSEQTDRPGVKGWDAACPRMLTWVRLGFKHNPLNSVYVVNTHFDHVGARARLESARIVRRTTDSLGGKPVIVLGDFNCGSNSPPYSVLTEDRGNLAELHDAHVAIGLNEADAGTYNAFEGKTTGPRIDWILFNRRFEALQSTIDRRSFDGHYPSDHFPVLATLRLLPATDTGAM